MVLPKEGVKGLRSNFLIKNMLGLLEAKEDEPEETGDLLNLNDTPETDTQGDVDNKSKRISQTQLLLYQAKEEILKAAVSKARRQTESLRLYKTTVEQTINEITKSKEQLTASIKERCGTIVDQIKKYESDLLEKVEKKLDVEEETRLFTAEANFVDEDLSSLENLIHFSEDVIDSRSLETVVAVTDDVVKNVSKISQRELKQLEWKSLQLNIPTADHFGQQIPDLIGTLKQMTIRSTVFDGSGAVVSGNPDVAAAEVPIEEYAEESTVRTAKTSTASDVSSPVSVHEDPDEIRIYPRYLADEFLVSPRNEEASPFGPDSWTANPLALAGFDEPIDNPPIPPRNFENLAPSSSPPPPYQETENEARSRDPIMVQNSQRNPGHSAGPPPARHHRGATRAKSRTKTPRVSRVTLKLPPALISVELMGTRPTGLDAIHDICINKAGDLCILGVITTKETVYQSLAIFTSNGMPKFCRKLIPYEPSYKMAAWSFAMLTFKGVESVALPLPEDCRIRIIPIEDPQGVETVRTVHFKFKNMLYRPFHVCNFKRKLWALGLDSFGKDSYEAKNKFDEWHPQSRVWDIHTAETMDGPVKPDTALIPCSTPPSCAKVDSDTSMMYLAERETVSAIRLLDDRGSLMWKFGETIKKKHKLKHVSSVCPDPSSGRVFVACQGSDRVVAISTEGQFLQNLVSDKHGIKKPAAIALDTNGQLVVGQTNGDLKVFKMST